jgi:hypothetical protein
MPTASELLEQAAKFRESAMRARRLAGTVNDADAIRLQSYCDQLLANASYLERQAAAVEAAGAELGTLLEQRQQEQQPQQTRSTDPKKER